MDAATGLTLQLTLLLILLAILAYFKSVELYRRLQVAQPPQELPGVAEVPVDLSRLDVTLLAGAGAALAHPPTDLGVTIAYLQVHYRHRRFTLPLGWQGVQGRPVLVVAHLVDDIYHMLLTAKSRAGKDNAALRWLLSLALLNPPERLQVAVLDGKGGVDWAGWQGKAHTWRLAIDKEEIAPAMAALTAERERRAVILREAGVSAWESYQGGELPLLVIYVSELLLLQDAMSPKELERWLNSELSAAGAFGMRYLIATQTASNFSTRWRGQVDLFAAGFQPSASQDQPNTGLTTAEITAAGAVPPSELPGLPLSRGVLTLVQGRQAETVRVGYLDDTERRRWLAQLPVKQVSSISSPKAIPVTMPATVTAGAMHGPVGAGDAHNAATDSRVTSVSGHSGADNGVYEDGSGNVRLPAYGNGGTDDATADLSDEAIASLLIADTPVRQIAARLRGRMQKRLERIARVRARYTR